MAEPRIVVLRRIVAECQYEKIDGYLMDATTAQMLIAVHDGLSEENQARFDSVPLARLVDFGWKQVRAA